MHLVHRDISPSNVFIARRGDVKLGDFGIAHAQERESKTQAGTLKGKYGYMSPEQVTGGELDGRSDIFAVGIVLAEMLMGKRLFTAPNDLDVLLMVRDGRLERWDKYGKDIPTALDAIVRKALAKNLDERYQTAAEFRRRPRGSAVQVRHARRAAGSRRAWSPISSTHRPTRSTVSRSKREEVGAQRASTDADAAPPHRPRFGTRVTRSPTTSHGRRAGVAARHALPARWSPRPSTAPWPARCPWSASTSTRQPDLQGAPPGLAGRAALRATRRSAGRHHRADPRRRRARASGAACLPSRARTMARRAACSTLDGIGDELAQGGGEAGPAPERPMPAVPEGTAPDIERRSLPHLAHAGHRRPGGRRRHRAGSLLRGTGSSRTSTWCAARPNRSTPT